MNELEQAKEEWGGTYKNYLIGLSLSFLLTIISFSLVGFKVFSNPTLAISITVLALVQATIQLIYFLHVGHEKAPLWRRHFFYGLIGVLLIIASGTLWIMHDLHDRVMLKEHHHD